MSFIPFTPDQTVISEYANSPTILQLIDNLDQQINPTTLFQTFYDYIWNISTAQGFGLDIWGRIINLPRQIDNVPALYPVIVAPGTVSMTDDQYRRALLNKALANISNSSAKSINTQLRNLSNGRGNAFVRNDGNMHLTYRFFFALEAYEHAIISAGNIISRPAGVGFERQTINPYFGFSEAGSWQPFDQGVFASY